MESLPFPDLGLLDDLTDLVLLDDFIDLDDMESLPFPFEDARTRIEPSFVLLADFMDLAFLEDVDLAFVFERPRTDPSLPELELLDDMESLPFPPFPDLGLLDDLTDLGLLDDFIDLLPFPPDFIDLLPLPEESTRRSATWIELSAVIGVVVTARTAIQAARQRAILLLKIIVFLFGCVCVLVDV